jgi:integrase
MEDKEGQNTITPDRKLFSVKLDSVSHAFKKACTKGGIEDLTLHDFRHEAISRLFEQGLNMMEVSHISGHKDFDMLKKYTNLKPEDILKKLLNKT